FAHLWVVVDEEHQRTARGLAGARTFEERLEVGAFVPAVATRRIEGRHAPDVGPLPDRALRNAEKLRRLAEREPIAVTACRPPGVLRRHPSNLPKSAGSLHPGWARL